MRRCFPRGPWLLLGNVHLTESRRPLPAERSRMRKGSEEALTWPARPTPGGDRDAGGRGQGWGDPVLGASEGPQRWAAEAGVGGQRGSASAQY